MSNAVVAKMKVGCIESSRHQYGTQTKVRMGAVYSDKGENAAFSKATPSGECWMNIDADAPALDFFKPGESYYVTFTKAPD